VEASGLVSLGLGYEAGFLIAPTVDLGSGGMVRLFVGVDFAES
jgi:hypothetical protein